ncbi:hypothetical protein Hanom_Chr15g01384901 [Helianthus anomalus]
MKHQLEEFEEKIFTINICFRSIFVIVKMVVVHHMLYKTVTRSNACSGKIGVTFDQRNFKVCFHYSSFVCFHCL